MACKLYPNYGSICQVYMAAGEFSIAVAAVWSVQLSKHTLLMPASIYSHYINSDQADRSAPVRFKFFPPFCCLSCSLAGWLGIYKYERTSDFFSFFSPPKHILIYEMKSNGMYRSSFRSLVICSSQYNYQRNYHFATSFNQYSGDVIGF